MGTKIKDKHIWKNNPDWKLLIRLVHNKVEINSKFTDRANLDFAKKKILTFMDPMWKALSDSNKIIKTIISMQKEVYPILEKSEPWLDTISYIGRVLHNKLQIEKCAKRISQGIYFRTG